MRVKGILLSFLNISQKYFSSLKHILSDLKAFFLAAGNVDVSINWKKLED
jgi:hypothetical protein